MHNLNAVLLAAEMEPRLFDLDFQLLADSLLTIIAVFVLFIALSYLLFNPARKFMQDRQNKIAGELDHAKTAQEDAEKLKAELGGLSARKTALQAELRKVQREEKEYDTLRQNVDALLERPKEQEQQRQRSNDLE
mgnify:CR=1 FL=1